MFVNNKKPPRIINQGRPRYYAQLALDAAHAVNLSGRATKLLSFYCDQADGFTPALNLIKQKTGIAANRISEFRQELVEHGLIQYDREAAFILIDWIRLRVFALMEYTSGAQLRKKDSKHEEWFAPVTRRSAIPLKNEPTIGQLIRKHQKTKNQRLEECPIIPRKLTADEKHLFDCLESMTETEYAA